ncbi:MAG TPA: DUF938 domain-containing protein [Candidatus Competibacteraceae bacterium]|nr:DUF938 domain-containing protein [Candidatus Competibacteraceae bacterium]
MPQLPYSEACEQNKEPILAVLRQVFTEPGLVLEIGSGTGQHAVHFAPALPHLLWQPSDLAENLPGIALWLAAYPAPNLRPAIELDVTWARWPVAAVDGVYSANTAHIMGWPAVEAMFAGIGRVLRPGGCFCLYGPFSYGGRHTADSNARFDQMLKLRDPRMGVRDVDELQRLARDAGLELVHDWAMPVNNRTLVWRRQG